MKMASVTLKDFMGRWPLFLLGLLLSVSVALGAVTTDSPTVSTSVAPTTTAVPVQTTITSTTGMTTTTTTQSTTPGASTPTANTAQGSASTQFKPPTALPSVSTPTMAASTNMSSMPTGAPSSSVTSMSSNMSTSSAANTTGSGMNGTTAWGNSSMSMISCPSFMCNYSDCGSMYKSQNTTMCAPGYNYCELKRQMGMCYTVSCSMSCSMSCINASQSNCTVNCCNSTGCLNETFASMMMNTTTPATTTIKSTTTSPTTTTTTTTSAPTTAAGKKCNSGACNGTDCYKNFNSPLVCTSAQPHCQLKKENVGANLQWTAGCTANCSGQTFCKASVQPPCHLECCNATLTSCLFLNGTLNVPNFATRGPQLHYGLVTSVLCLFALGLML